MEPEPLLTRARLAELAGVSATTVTNWANRAERPLHTVPAPVDGRPMFTWTDLVTFCQEHPELRAAARILRHLASPAAAPPSPPSSFDGGDNATLRAAVLDLRTAVDRATDAVVQASELAAHTAAANADIVRALRDTIRAYDSLTTSVAFPDPRN